MARENLLVLGKTRNRETMSDMTKCKGDGCSMRDSCYRCTAPANELYQSYFVTPPIEDGECKLYWGEVQQSIMDALQDIVDGKP